MRHQNPNLTWLELTETCIRLGDCKGEITNYPRHWWADDVTVVLEIVNAVRVLCTEGGPACRKLLGK